MRHIQQVLITLQKNKLYANLEKFPFGMNRVQYMGYIVDEHGVHVDPANIQFIRDWPALTTLTELQSFLGFQLLSIVHVGILPYCMGPQPSDQRWC
jgi:hypothetical protein